MGFSFDALGSKVDDAISAAPLSALQVTAAAGQQLYPWGWELWLQQFSDNTSFMAVAKYTIGPVKLYGGL